MRRVTFTVLGTPIPQGSKSALMAGGRPVVVEQGRAKLKPWRAQIADAAGQAMNGAGLMSGPLIVQVYAYLPRPKSHYRRSGELRDDAPEYVGVRPDLDKLARAVLDGMTGIVFRDDSQVAGLVCEKTYGDRPRVEVTVGPM